MNVHKQRALEMLDRAIRECKEKVPKIKVKDLRYQNDPKVPPFNANYLSVTISRIIKYP